MSSTLLIIFVSLGVVGFFVLGMSLTLIFKGRHIDSEIGDNENMKKLGIRCAVQQIREEEQELRGGESCLPVDCSSSSCATCLPGQEKKI